LSFLRTMSSTVTATTSSGKMDAKVCLYCPAIALSWAQAVSGGVGVVVMLAGLGDEGEGILAQGSGEAVEGAGPTAWPGVTFEAGQRGQADPGVPRESFLRHAVLTAELAQEGAVDAIGAGQRQR
jgi:hypothetical protein